MNKDLTVGNPQRVLWRFCLPLFGSIIFQQLYNIADSLVAGKFIGENALAAVGNSYEITLIFIAFAFGCNMGCSVIVSQLFGAKEYGRLKTAVSTACIFSAVLCLMLMVTDTLGCGLLLYLIRTPHEVFSDSKLYLYMGASICIFLQYCNWYFLCIGRFQDTVLFSCSIVNIKYCCGYSICKSLPYGRCRCRMGNFFMSGSQLHPSSLDCMDKT